MLLNGRVRLEVATVSDWTDDPSVSIQNNAFFRPTSWSWVDYTDGLLSVDISRGIDEYEGTWSQPAPGQLTIRSRNSQLNPQINSQIAYGHKIRVLVDGEPIFTGKIRETDVQYTNFKDDPITTIDAFDSWQSLLDFEFDNYKLDAGETSSGDETPPQENLKDSNLGKLFADAAFGPWYLYSWPLWYLTASPQPGDVILGYQGGLAVVKNSLKKEFAEWSVRGTNVWPHDIQRTPDKDASYWWPQVYLEPFTFRSFGRGPDFQNPLNETERKLYSLAHAQTTAEVDGAITMPLGTQHVLRNYDKLEWFYVSDDWSYNPATGQYVPPSTTEYRYQYGDVINNGKQVPVTYTEPWSIQNYHRFDYGYPPSNGSLQGFYSQFITSSNKLIDNILAFDQAEQGVIYTTKEDNFRVIPRSRILSPTGLPARANTVYFDSDGSSNSYYDVKVRDGVQSIVNKVVINNVYYSEDPDDAVDMYAIESFRRYDNGNKLSEINKAGTIYKAYEGKGVADIAVSKVKTKTFEYANEESIKRYGERSLVLNTNFAWPLYETVPGETSTPTAFTYWQAARLINPPTAQTDPATDGANTNWRFINVRNHATDPERQTYELYTANRTSPTGTESFRRNIPFQVEDLATRILNEYSLPQHKVQSVVWQPQTDEQITQASVTEIFDKVAIDHSAHGISINDTFRIMGMKHRIDPTSWQIEYQLWDEQGLP